MIFVNLKRFKNRKVLAVVINISETKIPKLSQSYLKTYSFEENA